MGTGNQEQMAESIGVEGEEGQQNIKDTSGACWDYSSMVIVHTLNS